MDVCGDMKKGLLRTFGHEALNRDKKTLEWTFGTKALMCGFMVDSEKELASLPADKVLKAQLVLADPLLDPGITRIPIQSVQKLRGQWNFGIPVVSIFERSVPWSTNYYPDRAVLLPLKEYLENPSYFS